MLRAYTSHIQMWEGTYFHYVDNIESIIAWYKGSGLRPYLAKLSQTEAICFENELLELLKNTYTLQKDGSVLLQISRLFFIAKLP